MTLFGDSPCFTKSLSCDWKRIQYISFWFKFFMSCSRNKPTLVVFISWIIIPWNLDSEPLNTDDVTLVLLDVTDRMSMNFSISKLSRLSLAVITLTWRKLAKIKHNRVLTKYGYEHYFMTSLSRDWRGTHYLSSFILILHALKYK